MFSFDFQKKLHPLFYHLFLTAFPLPTFYTIFHFFLLGASSTRSEEEYVNVKMRRNRLRSAQRAGEHEGYLRLRELVPCLRLRRKKPQRLEILMNTYAYITYLKDVMEKLQAIKAEREKAQTREGVKNMDGMIIHEVKK